MSRYFPSKGRLANGLVSVSPFISAKPIELPRMAEYLSIFIWYPHYFIIAYDLNVLAAINDHMITNDCTLTNNSSCNPCTLTNDNIAHDKGILNLGSLSYLHIGRQDRMVDLTRDKAAIYYQRILDLGVLCDKVWWSDMVFRINLPRTITTV